MARALSVLEKQKNLNQKQKMQKFERKKKGKRDEN